MKKILFVLTVTIMSQLVIAQQAPVDSSRTTAGKENRKHGKMRRGSEAPMKALNLTEDQQAKMKEMRQANKTKKDAVLADTKLTEDQKRTELKALHKAESGKLQEVLTDEQKAKFKALKEDRKRAKRSGKRDGKNGPAVTQARVIN